MRLYLIRHAQTAWNAVGRAQGHTDVELDETGHKQAERLAHVLRMSRIERVYTSDLLRCQQTARYISEALSIDLVVEEILRERRIGEWEGLAFTEFRAELRKARVADDPHGLHVRPPSGESISDVWNRLYPFSQACFAFDVDIAIVTHGGTCGVLLAQLLRAGLTAARGFRFGNATITELRRVEDSLFYLERYNDGSHHLREDVLTGSVDGTHD
jgi:probable phosphoglycerate mutase